MSMQTMIFLYGPPGTGKSTLARRLGRSLDLPFYDLDTLIEEQAGVPIAEIFARQGEAAFRSLEAACLKQVIARRNGVVALGGGALLDERSRAAAAASGQIVCLSARLDVLLERLQSKPGVRPLLGEQQEMQTRLANLLQKRQDHYASFALRLDTSHLSSRAAVWQIQALLGTFRVSGMGEPSDVCILAGGLETLGERLQACGLKGTVVVVSDAHTGPLYAGQAIAAMETAGFKASAFTIPAGEAAKTIGTIESLWQAFLAAGLERSSTVVALGGGVTGDLAGFAAATYLRGVKWVGVPTSLLAMVDASLGGKTGADLPQGKNLVGAFHPPSLVLVDPALLASLPQVELCNGLAEVVKHGVVGDPVLFERCAAGLDSLAADWEGVVRQAVAVKISVIQADPYEKGVRAALNLGHTVGHALETVSEYRLRHGEAVAIGMVLETRLAERIGLARPGLADRIERVLQAVGLPVAVPEDIDRSGLLPAMQFDKKKAGGKVRFSLPRRIGKVVAGVAAGEEDVRWMLEL
jgi:shikimate kinase/3-dehydroquinate synthase